jgi:hypothetical protein
MAYVGERGTLGITTGVGSTQDIPLASSCTSGNTLILIFASRCTSAAGISVTDSRGNTWTVDGGPYNFSNDLILVASTRQDVGRLITGDLVTVTFTTAPQEPRIAFLEEFSGLLTSSYVDQTANATGSVVTSLPTGTTGTTTQANEVAISAFCVDDSNINVVLTPDAGYSQFTSFSFTEWGTYKKIGAAQYLILTSTGAQASTITAGIAPNSYQGLIVTYKAAAAGNPKCATHGCVQI